MWGYMMDGTKQRRTVVRQMAVGNTAIYMLEMGRSQYSARRQMRNMKRCGVRTMGAAENTPWLGILKEEKIARLSHAPLRRKKAEEIITCWCRSHRIALRGKTVRLCAQRCDEDAVRVAFFLAKNARYVQLDIGYGQDMLQKLLWQNFGLSVGGEQPILQIALNEINERHIPTISLNDDMSTEICYDIPKDWQIEQVPVTEPLVAVLTKCGLPWEEIRVKSVKLVLDEEQKLFYNAM